MYMNKMSNENRTPTAPRGLTGPIHTGWSRRFQSNDIPKLVEPLPPAPKSPPSNLEPEPDTEAMPPVSDVVQTAQTASAEPTEPKPMLADKPKFATGKTKHQPGSAEDLFKLVPPVGGIPKKQLITDWRVRYGNHVTCRKHLEFLLTTEKLFVWRKNRSRTNAEILISRHPQPAKSE
jgi:hypothetical protein